MKDWTMSNRQSWTETNFCILLHVVCVTRLQPSKADTFKIPNLWENKLTFFFFTFYRWLCTLTHGPFIDMNGILIRFIRAFN